MKFTEIIKSYYDPAEEKIIVEVLKSQGLYKKLKDLTDGYYKSCTRVTVQAKQTLFRKMVSETILTMTLWSRQENAGVEKKHDTCRLMHLAYHLIRYAVLQSGTEETTYGNIVEEILESDEQSIVWKLFVLYNFKGDVFRLRSQNCNKMIADDIKPVIITCPYISWVPRAGDKVNWVTFESFLYDLMAIFKEVKSKKTVGMLFSSTPSNYKIIISREDIMPFLEIFRLLHKNKRIICHNSRGLFVLLKAHLKASEGQLLPDCKQYYRLKVKELNCTMKQILIMKRIEAIIEKYTQHEIVL